MHIVLIILAVILLGAKSPLYKRVVNEKNFFERGLYYYISQGFFMFLIGLPFLQKNIFEIFYYTSFYILFFFITLSMLGLTYIYKKSNPTVAVTMISLASMLNSIIYIKDISKLKYILPLAFIAILFLIIYKRESNSLINKEIVFAALFLIFLPNISKYYIAPLITRDFGNATSIYGLIKFSSALSLILINKLKIKDNLKAVSKSVSFSVLGQLLLFSSISLAGENVSIVFAILAFLPLSSEIITNIFYKKIYLGKKSKIQKLSISIFCICLSLIIYLTK